MRCGRWCNLFLDEVDWMSWQSRHHLVVKIQYHRFKDVLWWQHNSVNYFSLLFTFSSPPPPACQGITLIHWTDANVIKVVPKVNAIEPSRLFYNTPSWEHSHFTHFTRTGHCPVPHDLIFVFNAQNTFHNALLTLNPLFLPNTTKWEVKISIVALFNLWHHQLKKGKQLKLMSMFWLDIVSKHTSG